MPLTFDNLGWGFSNPAVSYPTVNCKTTPSYGYYGIMRMPKTINNSIRTPLIILISHYSLILSIDSPTDCMRAHLSTHAPKHRPPPPPTIGCAAHNGS